MKFLSSIKSKLIFLLIVTGMVPLLIAMAYSLHNAVTSAFEFAEHELKVTNELIEKEVSALMGSNFTESHGAGIFGGDARKSQRRHETRRAKCQRAL